MLLPPPARRTPRPRHHAQAAVRSERRQGYLCGVRSHLPRIDHAAAQLLKRMQCLSTFREGLLQDHITPIRYAAKKRRQRLAQPDGGAATLLRGT